MSNELLLTVIFTVTTIGISIYSSRNSAKKDVVEGLASLVSALEKRLENEEKARKSLEFKLAMRDAYIRVLVKQLRENNITPAEMPPDPEGG